MGNSGFSRSMVLGPKLIIALCRFHPRLLLDRQDLVEAGLAKHGLIDELSFVVFGEGVEVGGWFAATFTEAIDLRHRDSSKWAFDDHG